MTRGRDATTPLQMPWIAWRDILIRTGRTFVEDRVTLIGAGIAFFSLLALFPAVTALVAIGGLVVSPELLAREINALAAMLPASAAEIVIGQVREVVGTSEGGLGLAALASLALALYSASRGVGTVIQGLNAAYGETESRGFFTLQLGILGLTSGLILVLTVGLALAAALPVALAMLAPGSWLEAALLLLRWPLLFGIGVVSFLILYRFGPSRRAARWRWLAPGALIACALWIVATAGFALYVSAFGTYNETFGALAGVIVLLLWLWISAVILLLGAELDGEIEAQTARDSTIGRPRPMGQRGAVKADELGEAVDFG